jgi:flagellar hook protein FlgE
VDTAGPVGPITIPIGQQLDAVPTTQITVQGNLDARENTEAGDRPHFVTKVSITDSLGMRHEVYITFKKDLDDTNIWYYTITKDNPYTEDINEGVVNHYNLDGGVTGILHFDENGNLIPQGASESQTNIPQVTITPSTGAAKIVLTAPSGLDFSRLTQLAAPYSANAAANGAPAGSLTTFTVSQSGQVLGIYSNGVTKVVGQIALALFTNPGGLMKVGGNAYQPTVNSGEPIVGPPDSGGRGKIASGYLEMSNVDLAQEFTSMIMAQRGFQANSRVITTSDEVLQELVNLRR